MSTTKPRILIFTASLVLCFTNPHLVFAAKFQDIPGAPKTRKESVEKCKELVGDPRDNPKTAGKELIQLLAQWDAEKDPEKRKELQPKKKAEMEKFDERVDKACNKLYDNVFRKD